jgi:hypothetical protein
MVMLRRAGHVARIREKRNANGYWGGGEPERKRPIGRPRRSCVNNIKIDLGEIVRGIMDWIDISQDMDK